MTIDNQTNKNQYTANGSNTAFGYGFKINASSEVTIIVTDTAGADTTQVETTDYTVAGVGNNGGGNINFVTAPTDQYTVTIIRNVPLTQATDYIDNDSFSSTGHEDGLDKTTMIAQRQQEEIDRGIKVRTSSDVSFDPEIDLTSGESKYLRVNAAGDGIELADGTVTAGAGLNSVDGVSNTGGNVDFKSDDGTVTITPNDGANTIDFSASATQPMASLAGVTNPSGDISMPNGTAITITPDDGANSITVAFDASGVTANSISGNALDGGTYSNFTSTGITDSATSTKLTIADAKFTSTANIEIDHGSPKITLHDNGGPADGKNVHIRSDSGDFFVQMENDAEDSSTFPFTIKHTGTTIDEIKLNGAILNFDGAIDMSGTVDCTGTESFKVPVGTTAQRPASPTNGDTRYNTTDSKLESYIAGSWEDIATGTGSGETNTASALTSGAGTEGDVFKQKAGVDLEFRAIKQGTNITITENANDITISASGSVGESNTSSNVGGKTGTIFKQKTGIDLELKTISGSNGITITNNASDIDISGGSSSIFNVLDSGAVGDGSTDDTAAINTAITALLAGTNGGILYFPGGEYKISTKLTITLGSNDESIIIKGDGEELTQLSFTGAIDGIEIISPNGGQLQGDKNITRVQDLSIETDTAGGQVGLLFTGSATASLAPVTRVEGVVFSGNTGTNYWGTSLHFDESVFTTVSGCIFNGPGAAGTPLGTGLRITGTGTAPVDHHILNCFWLAQDTGILIEEEVEGVYVNQVTMVSMNKGIVWNTTAGEPLLTLVGSHINAWNRCLDLNNCIQFLIQGNLLYADSNRTGAWIGIECSGSYGSADNVGGNISDNVFEVLAGTTPTNAIVFDNVGGHTVTNNKINNPDTGVWLKAGSDNNVVLDNYVTSFAANAVLDDGSNNIVRLVGSTSAFRGALVYLTSDQSISNSTSQAVSWHAEDYDTSSIWSSGTRFTVPSGVTRIRMKCQMTFAANASGIRRLDIKKNGGDYVGRVRVLYEASSSQKTAMFAESAVLRVTAGDYFEIDAFQTSGSSLNLAGSTNLTWAAMEIVE